jgi:hypothetical protein
MGKSNNYSQQFDDKEQSIEEWEYEDDWEEDSVYARKEHQNHRGGKKRQTRRSIEEFMEQQQLKKLLGEDYSDFG